MPTHNKRVVVAGRCVKTKPSGRCAAYDALGRRRIVQVRVVAISNAADNPERAPVEKRRDYAEVAIPAYWIVDPRTATLTVLTLDDAASSEPGMSTRGRTATSVLLDGVAVAITGVFDAA